MLGYHSITNYIRLYNVVGEVERAGLHEEMAEFFNIMSTNCPRMSRMRKKLASSSNVFRIMLTSLRKKTDVRRVKRSI